ncbi:MAG: DNA replication and repair protein RecF [Spirochaetaceae bacterium]|jgi:DNA replication and repair protein RecF|nr:DNA replication and repair protein RecF [Spirochaetaceae bacterium]
MYFSSIRLYNFRNLCDDEISLKGKDIFLVGENAQGKSNFLESLYFCSFASSFRGAKDAGLIRNGEKNCAVSAHLEDSPDKNIQIKIENGKKQILIDEKRCEDRKRLLSVIPSIIFCHEDMEFVRGGQERRRWFFDQNRSLYDGVYLDELRRYKRILKTRNAVLKEIRETGDLSKQEILEILDPQLVECGLNLIKKRNEEISLFSDIFNLYYKEIANIENIYIQYKTSWHDSSIDTVLEHIKQKRDTEIKLSVTLSGPHRDKYIFMRDANEFDTNASTGQRRLLALLLRLAQARRFLSMTGNKPVLLLDDVLLELDGKKREKFLKMLPDYGQAFYTFLPEEPYQNYLKEDTKVFFVNGGKLDSNR